MANPWLNLYDHIRSTEPAHLQADVIRRKYLLVVQLKSLLKLPSGDETRQDKETRRSREGIYPDFIWAFVFHCEKYWRIYGQMGTVWLGLLAILMVVFQVRLLAVVVMAATHFLCFSRVKLESWYRPTSSRKLCGCFVILLLFVLFLQNFAASISSSDICCSAVKSLLFCMTPLCI